jgi:lysophospholipase L1-like esterase
MVACAVLDHRGMKKPATVVAVCLAPAWIAMAWTWSDAGHTTRRPALVPDRPIVCMGDSLSAGGYPGHLARRLSVPVVDKSAGGSRTPYGLRLLPEVLALRPQAVVLELGGNDFTMGKGRRETRANLETMIRAIRETGAEVFLFEIPRGFVYDSFWGIDRQLARQHDLELVHDGAIRQLVLFGPGSPLTSWSGRQLSYDGLHPNDAGHAFLAGRVEASLRRVYGDAILARK